MLDTDFNDPGLDSTSQDEIIDAPAEDIEAQTPVDDADLMEQELIEMDEGGTPVRLKGAEVLNRLSRAQELERQNQELLKKVEMLDLLKPHLQQPKEEQRPVQQQPQNAGIDAKAIGIRLQKMLEGEEGGVEAIGDSILNLISQVADQRAMALIQRSTEQQKVQSKFQTRFDSFDNAVSSGKVAEFIKQSGLPFNEIEGYLAMLATEKDTAMKEMEAKLKAAEAAGKRKGEQETVKQMKARGTFRLIGGGQKAAPGVRTPTQQFSTETDRAAAMLEGLRKMRGGRLD